jgi:hypothetical protein
MPVRFVRRGLATLTALGPTRRLGRWAGVAVYSGLPVLPGAGYQEPNNGGYVLPELLRVGSGRGSKAARGDRVGDAIFLPGGVP